MAYKHFPPYPAFLNNACFMSSELTTPLCSISYHNHQNYFSLTKNVTLNSNFLIVIKLITTEFSNTYTRSKQNVIRQVGCEKGRMYADFSTTSLFPGHTLL